MCPWERVKKSSSAKDVTTEAEEVADNVESLDIKTSEPPQKRFRGFREDPFIYFNDDEKVFDNIRKYYNLTLPPSLFLHRNKVDITLSVFDLGPGTPSTLFSCSQDPTTRKNNIYFSTAKVRQIVENNVDRVKIINTGVKSFARADNKGSECDYRSG